MTYLTLKEKIEKELNRFIKYSIFISLISIVLLVIISEMFIVYQNNKDTFKTITTTFDDLLTNYDQLFKDDYNNDLVITKFYQLNSKNKLKANFFVFKNNELIISTNSRLSNNLKPSLLKITTSSKNYYKVYPLHIYNESNINNFLITRKLNDDITYLFLLDKIALEELLLQRQSDQVLIIDRFDNVVTTSSLLLQNPIRKFDPTSNSFTNSDISYTLKTSYYKPLDLNIVSLVHTNN
ncbi:MAG: hypothetical protein ACRCTA_01925, partial [Bacilli bacterium]